jgi:hypothetical protein
VITEPDLEAAERGLREDREPDLLLKSGTKSVKKKITVY